MQSIRLNINENAYQRVIEFLKVFNSDEVVIITEDETFISNQNYLRKELNEINNGDEEFLNQEEFETSLNEVISKHENRL
ncbi:MAG: hypothetical protein RLZZ546_2860 [Bacteroidota bacterium]|jgi:hypothetical protein